MSLFLVVEYKSLHEKMSAKENQKTFKLHYLRKKIKIPQGFDNDNTHSVAKFTILNLLKIHLTFCARNFAKDLLSIQLNVSIRLFN